MPRFIDGPASTQFQPVPICGNAKWSDLSASGVSTAMADAAADALTGACVCNGLPMKIASPVVLTDRPVTLKLDNLRAGWLVVMHTSDVQPVGTDEHGFISPMRGEGQLGEHAADYVVVYADGSEHRLAIRRRYQLGAFTRHWGENCFQSVVHAKMRPARQHHEHMTESWGRSQTRADYYDGDPWVNWLWAWENPNPRKAITAIRLEPISGVVVLSAISAGRASSQPLRWRSRRKAILRLPRGEAFDPTLDAMGQLTQVRLDLGQIISAQPRTLYPNATWPDSYNNQVPALSDREVLVEYSAHEDAHFHLPGGKTVPVARLEQQDKAGTLTVVEPATKRVTLRVIRKGTGEPVTAKLHVHGRGGEYLAPLDRHRIPNAAWFEDYSVDFVHKGLHVCTYIPGQTTIDLPIGEVYVEISRGFEMKPVRRVVRVGKGTRQVTIEIDKVLDWRERGWVSADTHVHFLSPNSALMEGAGEGVNVVNLLASQWGELMTNVGDFDGKTTHGSIDTGGDGEHLVRVGTENRQHVLGHISLLGYRGGPIVPMTTAGPDESALGDPIDVLLSEWARQCKDQGGLVVLPHFPHPRAEHAAAIVHGEIDAVEMTSWGDLYGGIDPYSLSDWYRYLNCGYLLPAVGGTDKMGATTAVGTVRTYARLADDQPFTYDAWMNAVRRAHTFVTYGPLMEFAVDGQPAGSTIHMSATGGTVDVTWEVASVTVPMSRVDLIVNGEIRESLAVKKWADAGMFTATLDKSSWGAILVRGHYTDKPEIIAAHSSPVMVKVGDTPFMAAADAMTILEQIEGSLAYLETIGTRAEDKAYKRMRMILTNAHRALHNRMHAAGQFHQHSPVDDHPEHH